MRSFAAQVFVVRNPRRYLIHYHYLFGSSFATQLHSPTIVMEVVNVQSATEVT